jgi:hypothetical protein
MSKNVLIHILKGLILNLNGTLAGAFGGAITALIASMLLGIESEILLVLVFAFFMIGGALIKAFPRGVYRKR